ncbi:MAG: hypothetical protein M3Y72_23250 [Acidobacteriota bacterium]|nr:hypothetical protein [Acidobacteriota bacterium]
MKKVKRRRMAGVMHIQSRIARFLEKNASCTLFEAGEGIGSLTSNRAAQNVAP